MRWRGLNRCVFAIVVSAATAAAGCSSSTRQPAPRSSGASVVQGASATTVSRVPELSAYPSPSGHARAVLAMLALSSVNGADATAVALAAVRAIEQSDTAVDADPNATVRRASAWLAPAFAEQVRRFPPVAAPGAQWNEWAAHRAYLQVRTSLAGDDRPADSPMRAYRQVVAVLQPIGRDGWRGRLQTRVVFVMLTRSAGQLWRLAREQSN